MNNKINEAKEPDVIAQLRKIVKDKQNALVVDTKSKKKVRVDMQSASLMVQVYDALKQQSNKDKFVKGGIVSMGHMAYKLMKKESVVTEASMSDIDIMAQEAKDFKSFVKEFKKEYKDIATSGKPSEFKEWLQSIYDMAKEHMDESVNEGNVKNSEILDVIDSIQNLIKNLKNDSSKKSPKLFTAASPLVKELHKLLESVTEETKRDYKDEYKKFQSSDKSKKYRAELNKYNRDKGTYGNGDGKDASHKGGKIVGFESESKNRGRAEKSRLKKEVVTETLIREAKMKLGKDSANFKVFGTKSGLTLMAATSKDLDLVQDAIVNDVDVKGELRKTLEKQLKIPVDIDRSYEGAGYRFSIDFTALAKQVK